MESGVTLGCCLNDLPKYLKLMNTEFRLAGIIVSSSGHHTNYCWQVNKTWEFCNNLGKSIEAAAPKTRITPSAAIYVKILTPGNRHDLKQNGLATGDQLPLNETVPPTPILSPTPSLTRSPQPSKDQDLELKSEVTLQESVLDDNLFTSAPPMNTEDFRSKVRDPDTYSYDNWRNLGDSEGFWVDATDESTLNGETLPGNINDSLSRPTNPILHAGHIMFAVEIDGNFLHVMNTTALDSIIHIILYRARDDPNYMDSIHPCASKLLRFIISLMNRDFDMNVYIEKGALLVELFPERLKQRMENGDVVRTLDLNDSVNNLWGYLFGNDPSVFKLFNCAQCGEYAVDVPIINIDSNLIFRKGLTVLQEALQFYPNLTKVPCCNAKCKRLCTVTCTANLNIYIDLELSMRGRLQKTVQSKLGDIPMHLNLGMTYRIAGVIAHSDDGFMAYCLRESPSNSWWEMYDSGLGQVQSAGPSNIIKPHGAIYVVQ
ncbi:uncharacterized protein LOC135167850 [Diachasmimorpha longicaudata]|uniref:uncharacterized protein LOC135167850 n=1 Tax=Diachasmimorpha longicaudata TaxID=58733 RepID=UPI0030B8924A